MRSREEMLRAGLDGTWRTEFVSLCDGLSGFVETHARGIVCLTSKVFQRPIGDVLCGS